MCDIVGQAVRAGVSRRNVLRAALGGAAVLGVAACSGNTGPAANQPSTTGTPAPAGPPPAEGARTQLVLLGTSGGPPYWPGSDREGIASALLVGDRYYVVDAGAGVLRQMRSAQLGNWQHDTDGPLDAMRAIFLTHLHSDHVVDLNNLLTEGLYNGLAKVDRKVQIWGPGNIGPIAERAQAKTLVLSHIVPGNWPADDFQRAQNGYSGTLVVGKDLDRIGVVKR